MKIKNDIKTFTLRQLRIRGWRRFLVLNIIAGTVIQLIVLAILSGIGFAAFESGGGPSRDWHYAAFESSWVYKYPAEPIIIPFDKYGETGVVVGARIVGMPYFKLTHGDDIETTPIDGPGLLASSYTPPQNEHVYQFVEDRIGFPFQAARSVFFFESTSSPSIPRGEHWVTHHGIQLSGETGSSSLPLPREFVAIPLSPMIQGFVLNTLIYAIPVAMLAMIFRMFRLAKARARGRRGKCVSCRYEILDQSQCPECGMYVQSEWKAALWAGCKLRHLSRLRR